MSFATIAIAAPLYQLFTYKIPEEVKVSPGMRVVVSFGNRNVVGYVVEVQNTISKTQDKNITIKEITRVLDETPTFSIKMLEFIKWLAEYYNAPIGDTFRSAIPKGLAVLPKEKKRTRQQKETVIDDVFALSPKLKLTKSQIEAYKNLNASIKELKFKTILLHGVTGSGKTEIYFKCFSDVIDLGRQSLFLVPEIGLTPQFVGQVTARFGRDVATYHSGLTDLRRLSEWRRIQSGEAKIVVGTRSAIFAPFKNLGLIVVDEEHDTSYKQEESPRYNGRDAAVMRSKIEGIPCILGSATPSMESFNNAKTKKYNYIHLSERPSGVLMPSVEIVDMRDTVKSSNLSPRMVQAISETLNNKEQVMLFLNRRGFATFLLCRDCGHTYTCPNCSISLVYHMNEDALTCHYCDYKIKRSHICEKCHSTNLHVFGSGTERLESDLNEIFPRAKIARLDRDTASKSGVRPSVLANMKSGHTDILIGTQMITKGHDFPGVTLVGVINADTSINFPDFRAAERTFQLVTQVAGRAGRVEKRGHVIIQTYSPEHYAVDSASRHDFFEFYEKERFHRAELGYPPFGKLALIRIQGTKGLSVEKYANELASNLQRLTSNGSHFSILGPAPAPLAKVRGKYRWQLLIKSNNFNGLRTAINKVRDSSISPPRHLQVIIDVDPLNML